MKFDNSLIDNLTKTSKKKKTLFIDDEVLNEEVISRRVPHVRVGTVAIKTKGKKISTRVEDRIERNVLGKNEE